MGITDIFCQEWVIFSGVVRYYLMVGGGWLKKVVEDVDLQRRWIHSSGFRVMEVGTKANSCSKGFGGSVGMERPDGAVDEKNWDLKVHGENQYLPGEIDWVRLQWGSWGHQRWSKS